MLPDEFVEKMRPIANSGDTEVAHDKGDRLMCQVLRELGYGEGVTLFEEMTKCPA